MLYFLIKTVDLRILKLLKARLTAPPVGAQCSKDLKLMVMASSYDDFTSPALRAPVTVLGGAEV